MIAALLVNAVPPAPAFAATGSVWTTSAPCSTPDAPQNQNQYIVGQTVHVRGSNFTSSYNLTWRITGPNGTSPVYDTGTFVSGTGSFCYPTHLVTNADVGREMKLTVSLTDSPYTDLKSDNFSASPNPLSLVKNGTLDKGLDGILNAGDTINYNLVVKNSDKKDALTVVSVTDPLLGTISCPGGNPIPSLASKTSVTCTGSYTIKQSDIDAGKRDNTATADSNETPPVTASFSVTLPTTYSINLAKTGSLDGNHIDYSLSVTNTGSGTLTAVTVSDPKLATVTCPGGNPIPSLAPNASVTCTGSYTYDQADLDAGHVDNTATASNDNASDLDNETVTFPDVCNNLPGAQITIPAGLVAVDGACVEPPVDVCNNIDGDQATIPAGYISDGNGGCVLPLVDVCNNIEGVQTTIPGGLISDGQGGCIIPPTDVCNNIDGVQTSMPDGYQSNGTGGCEPIPVDVCNNISGVQTSIPDGLISNGQGGCVVPPTDVCNNIGGVQTSIPAGYQSNGTGGCELIPEDVCNNIEGIQTSIPGGLISDGQGSCVIPPTDVCNNIDGVQTSIPAGYQSNGTGGCELIPLDVCNNIDGVQTSIPAGYQSNGTGACELIPEDVCNNIGGVQITIPAGYQSNGTGGCELFPVDVCNNVEGVQTTIPDGLIFDGQGGCVVPPADVCNNIGGVQTSIPAGYQTNGTGGCVLIPVDVCNNIEGVQTTIPTGYQADGTGGCVLIVVNLNSPVIPVTGDVLIPVTGIDTRIPGSFSSKMLFFGSMTFLGLGLVINGSNRKEKLIHHIQERIDNGQTLSQRELLVMRLLLKDFK